MTMRLSQASRDAIKQITIPFFHSFSLHFPSHFLLTMPGYFTHNSKIMACSVFSSFPPKNTWLLFLLKQSSMEMKRRISEISKKVKDMNFSRKTASNSGLKMARSIIFSLPKPCHIIKLNKADKGSDIKIASGLIYCIIITIRLSHADMLGN